MQVPREGLVAKLQKLSQSQQSIESVSSFCVFYHKDARGVVAIWEEEFFKAPNDRKMALLYLANHILQEGRRKGTVFQDEFFKVLPKAMSHVMSTGDDRMKRSVTRLISIWEERRVFGTRHIKSFQGLVGGGGGGGGGGAAAAGAAASGGGGGAAGGYRPSRQGSGGMGPSAGDAVSTAAKAAAATADKRRVFEASWKPELPIAGDLAAVTTISGHLQAYEAALQRELDARRDAVASMQAAVRAQEEAIAAAAAQLGACGAQRQQLQARMAQLSAGLVAGLQGLKALGGLGGPPPPGPPLAPANPALARLPPPGPPLAPAAAAATNNGAAPPGSPLAPALEDEDDDDDDAAMELVGLDEEAPTGPPAPPPGAPGAGHLLADALSKLPDSERSRLGVDLQQLMSSGLLAAPGAAPGAAAAAAAAATGGGYGDGGMGSFADEGEDPYDPENPF